MTTDHLLKRRKPLPPHWYEVTIHTCPVCGGGETFRERRFTPKPSDPAERFHYREIYNWCNER